MRLHTPVFLLAIGIAPASLAHHGFAPHFDADRGVVLDGTVIEFEERNPHSYLHLEVIDDQGRAQEWVCESHGVTMLQRNGVTRDILRPGAKLRIEGDAARRDPFGCFFRTIELADGTRLSVNGPAVAAATPTPAVAAATSTPVAAASATPAAVSPARAAGAAASPGIYGTWLMQPRRPGGNGAARSTPMSDYLSEAGRQASAGYDPYTDDPVLRCDAIGIRRVWFAVGTPLEIRRDGDRILIRYEWMDAERVVHLDVDAPPEDFDADSLGYSIGRFEGDTLLIDTVYARGGVMSQYEEQEDGSQIGLLHSEAMLTQERVRIDSETGLLNVTIDTHDPVYYTQALPSVTGVYARSDLSVEPFGCMPE